MFDYNILSNNEKEIMQEESAVYKCLIETFQSDGSDTIITAFAAEDTLRQFFISLHEKSESIASKVYDSRVESVIVCCCFKNSDSQQVFDMRDFLIEEFAHNGAMTPLLDFVAPIDVNYLFSSDGSDFLKKRYNAVVVCKATSK